MRVLSVLATRTVRFALMLAFAGLTFVSASARAQNSSNMTVTQANASGSPTGADFAAGFWLVSTWTYTVNCGSNRLSCTVSLQSTAALSKPASAVTRVQYSWNGGAWQDVTTSAVPLETISVSTPKSGTVAFRYLLGWAFNGSNPFTPASVSAYSLPVQLTLKQG